MAPIADAPALAVDVPAEVMAFGDELTVNEEVDDAQTVPQMTQLSDDRVLFTWTSEDPNIDGSVNGIAARIGTVQSDGSIIWDSAGEFTVNAEVQNIQDDPQVIQLGDGRVLFTWKSSDPNVDGSSYGLSARIGTVQADGSIVWGSAGEFTINVQIQSVQDNPQVTQLSDGSILFAWRSFDTDVDGDSSGIAARIGTVQSDGSIVWGSAGEFTVNNQAQDVQDEPQVLQLNDGRVLFMWHSSDPDVDGSGTGITARIGTVQGDGSIMWSAATEVTVNEAVAGSQLSAEAIQLSDGRVLFTWHSFDPGESGRIAARVGMVQSDGSILWGSAGELTVEQQTEFGQTRPQVTQLGDDRILFTWQSSDPDVDGNNTGIAARIGTVQSDGSILWDSAGEFTINLESQGAQTSPQVTQLSDGRVLLTWQSADPEVDGNGSGISARILTLGYGGEEDTPIDIDISAALADTDGSESLVLKLTGFPAGATFSLGTLQGAEWVIDNPAELAALVLAPLTMTPPPDYNGTFTLSVAAEVTDAATLSTGVETDTTSAVQDFVITVTPVDEAPLALAAASAPDADGDDHFVAGPGADRFEFSADFGNDTIGDFNAAEDVIAFDAALFADVDAVMANTADDGLGNAVITYDDGNTVTLSGVSKAQLVANPGAFDFV